MEKWFSVPFDEVFKPVSLEEIEKIKNNKDKAFNE